MNWTAEPGMLRWPTFTRGSPISQLIRPQTGAGSALLMNPEVQSLRALADKCRRLAPTLSDPQDRQKLLDLARESERLAEQIDALER